MNYPQGDARLIETDLAQRLLQSTIPGRLAYTALDRTPRVISTWFVWTGTEIVMATYLRCPPLGIQRPARRLGALRANPHVAMTIDTEPQPPEVLLLRGSVHIDEVDGMVPEQARAAHRYLGPQAGAEYVSQAAHPETKMARIAFVPVWVGVLDFTNRYPNITIH